jgi:rRNA maturation endonuclease Nob1
MNTMLMDGFKVVRSSDSSYEVRDSRGVIGHVVRHDVQVTATAVKQFRAFGEDFLSLADAVAEFCNVKTARPFDAKGDEQEQPTTVCWYCDREASTTHGKHDVCEQCGEDLTHGDELQRRYERSRDCDE